MEPIDPSILPEDGLVLLDSAPIIYVLEDHPKFAPRFQPLFEWHAKGRVRFAITTITITEVLTGPLSDDNEYLVRRYRGVFSTWQMVPLDPFIAETAARMRAKYRLKLADAIQAASALVIDADALVTHDRDFSSVSSLLVIS